MATSIPENSCSFTLGEVATATGGTIFPGGSDTVAVRGVSIDSRTLTPGAVFVALKGPTNDGHAYLRGASARGAVAAMVERGRHRPSLPCVEVTDTLAALGDLARFHLERECAVWRRPSLAVAGSAGKTTTKEIVAALVATLFGPTLSTPGNLNNLIGVPMTLFTLTQEHRAVVLECGTNTRGEIARLGAIFRPDVTLLLNVDIEHSEGLGTIDEIADEETSLFRFTARSAVAPAGDQRISSRIPGHLRVLTFGDSKTADVRLAGRSVTSHGRSRIEIELAPTLVQPGVVPRIETELELLGTQSASNAAAATAAAISLWAKPMGEAELKSIGNTLTKVRAVQGRLSTASVGGIFVIDDSYNSNPRSARAALEAASEVARDMGARLVVAMGDMLELGALSAQAHAELLAEVARLQPAAFVAVGSEILAACRDAGDAYAATAVLAADSEEASRLIRTLVRPGDVLLVKGSRGTRMERIVEALQHG